MKKFILTLVLIAATVICNAQDPSPQTTKNTESINLLMIAVGALAGVITALGLYVKALHSKMLKTSITFAEVAVKMTTSYEAVSEKLNSAILTTSDKVSGSIDRNTSVVDDLHKFLLNK